jgi:hypothetical protein
MEQSHERSNLAKKERKKKKSPIHALSRAMEDTGGSRSAELRWFFFFFNLIHSYRPKLVYRPVFSEMGRNGRNRQEWSGF